jgi:predicted nucleic acid-binding protein
VILVDTSVWIATHRSPDSGDAQTLRSLLDSGDVALPLPVRIEFVAAAPRKDRGTLRRVLSALPLVVPTDDTWQVVESWTARARDAGYAFNLADLLIAALAHELTGLVWSLEKDFGAMEKLGLIRCY